ncbi:hypothetical protein [Glutamicibacter arilaitensis]|uniref:hypothetical protein n=1 Tax=Glutamicibacter arilaitensis TaxID=256701 RepID=UPI003FD10714
MKKYITHKFTLSMISTGLLIWAMTLIGGHAYPVPFAILWGCYTVALGFAIVGIRKDVKE